MISPNVNLDRQKPRGFTLIEVMVAVAIIALTLVSVTTLVNTLASTTVKTREKINGLFILESYLTEQRIDLTKQRPRTGNSSTTFTIGDKEYILEQLVTSTDNEEIFKVEYTLTDEEDIHYASLVSFLVENISSTGL